MAVQVGSQSPWFVSTALISGATKMLFRAPTGHWRKTNSICSVWQVAMAGVMGLTWVGSLLSCERHLWLLALKRLRRLPNSRLEGVKSIAWKHGFLSKWSRQGQHVAGSRLLALTKRAGPNDFTDESLDFTLTDDGVCVCRLICSKSHGEILLCTKVQHHFPPPCTHVRDGLHFCRISGRHPESSFWPKALQVISKARGVPLVHFQFGLWLSLHWEWWFIPLLLFLSCCPQHNYAALALREHAILSANDEKKSDVPLFPIHHASFLHVTLFFLMNMLAGVHSGGVCVLYFRFHTLLLKLTAAGSNLWLHTSVFLWKSSPAASWQSRWQLL